MPPHVKRRDLCAHRARREENGHADDREDHGIQRSNVGHRFTLRGSTVSGKSWDAASETPRRASGEIFRLDWYNEFCPIESRGVGLVVGRQPSKLIYTSSNLVPRSNLYSFDRTRPPFAVMAFQLKPDDPRNPSALSSELTDRETPEYW